MSAQPDTNYFIWQLQIQLTNFFGFGIEKSKIHVLISFDESKGINPNFLFLQQEFNDKALFFFYPDKRIDKKYLSTIRPHILSQHYKENPELSNSAIFYHDSDIIFTESLPDFKRLCNDDIWYFSDATAYVNSGFINQRGKGLLKGMCDAIGIDEKLVIENDNNAGGAQSILKGVDYLFWDKVESDCLKLYYYIQKSSVYFERRFEKKNIRSGLQFVKLSSWCADMWALLWNAFQRAKVRIDSDLDFCWPHEDISRWTSTKIFHNAGVTGEDSEQLFFKGHYMNSAPFDHDFGFVSADVCDFNFVKDIYRYADKRRYNCRDVTFLIPIRIDSQDRLDNITTILSYLTRYFDADIIVMEGDIARKIKEENIPENVKYYFVHDESELFYRELYNNEMVKLSKTEIVVKYDCDVILSPEQMMSAILNVRNKIQDICYPYNGNFLQVKGVIKKQFSEDLNVRLLHKYIVETSLSIPSYGGCVVLNKDKFQQMGLDNPFFEGWGFEDQELYKRAKILGYKIGRSDGPLYHLHHARGRNSTFFDDKECISSYSEYIYVCNMDKETLIQYISSWNLNIKKYLSTYAAR